MDIPTLQTAEISGYFRIYLVYVEIGFRMHFWPVQFCLCVDNIRDNETITEIAKALSAEEKALIDAYEKSGK